MQRNALRYGSELWKIRSGQQTPRLIREAPVHIQYAVTLELYGHHLFDNEIFGSLHEDLIRQLTFQFKDTLFFPGDRIVNVGDIDETIYFIHTGIVAVSNSSKISSISEGDDVKLGPGDYFGLLQGLYEKMPHTATYTAKTTTHIIFLYRPHWINLLKYFPVSTVNLYTAATRILRSSGLQVYTQSVKRRPIEIWKCMDRRLSRFVGKGVENCESNVSASSSSKSTCFSQFKWFIFNFFNLLFSFSFIHLRRLNSLIISIQTRQHFIPYAQFEIFDSVFRWSDSNSLASKIGDSNCIRH